MTLEVIHLHAAGVDVGSKSHYVAIGQSLNRVKEFGVYAEDLSALSTWLLAHQITTVAIDSTTGDYWQNLHGELEHKGLEVLLVNGSYSKNVKGKKPMF